MPTVLPEGLLGEIPLLPIELAVLEMSVVE
jgi:hypothetical protein